MLWSTQVKVHERLPALNLALVIYNVLQSSPSPSSLSSSLCPTFPNTPHIKRSLYTLIWWKYAHHSIFSATECVFYSTADGNVFTCLILQMFIANVGALCTGFCVCDSGCGSFDSVPVALTIDYARRQLYHAAAY